MVVVAAAELCVLLMCVYSILLNVMYMMVETLRWPSENESDEWKRLRENFRTELCMLRSVFFVVRSRCRTL